MNEGMNFDERKDYILGEDGMRKKEGNIVKIE